MDQERAVYAECISGCGSYSRARLVVLSVVVSIVGAYASWAVYERIRARRRLALGAWLIGGATSDGIATWSMRYTGILALQLPTPLYLHWPNVLLSLMVSIAGWAAALGVVSRGALRWSDTQSARMHQSAEPRPPQPLTRIRGLWADRDAVFHFRHTRCQPGGSFRLLPFGP